MVFRAVKHASPCRAGPARRSALTLPWLQLRLPSQVCPSDTCVALEEMAALGGITSSLRSHDIEILLASGRIRIKPRVGIYKKQQKKPPPSVCNPDGLSTSLHPSSFFPSLTHLSDRTCSHTNTHKRRHNMQHFAVVETLIRAKSFRQTPPVICARWTKRQGRGDAKGRESVGVAG